MSKVRFKALCFGLLFASLAFSNARSSEPTECDLKPTTTEIEDLDQHCVQPKSVKVRFDDFLRVFGLSKSSRNYALIVSVSNYDARNWQDLQTASDPIRMRNYLLTRGGFDSVRVLTGANVTYSRLRHLMEDVLPEEIQEQDRFVFYWSGHGETRDRGSAQKGYLVLKNSRPKTYSTMVPMADILQWDNDIDAHQVLYLLDACFSGHALIQAKAGFSEEDLTRANLSAYMAPVRHVLTAGRRNEEAIVDTRVGSIFTTAVLDALENGKANQKSLTFGADQVISFEELTTHVVSMTKLLAKGLDHRAPLTPQSASFKSEGGSFYFPLLSVVANPDEVFPNLKSIKVMLSELGYQPGDVADNRLTFGTQAALVAFQRRFKLDLTARPDRNTLPRIIEEHRRVISRIEPVPNADEEPKARLPRETSQSKSGETSSKIGHDGSVNRDGASNSPEQQIAKGTVTPTTSTQLGDMVDKSGQVDAPLEALRAAQTEVQIAYAMSLLDQKDAKYATQDPQLREKFKQGWKDSSDRISALSESGSNIEEISTALEGLTAFETKVRYELEGWIKQLLDQKREALIEYDKRVAQIAYAADSVLSSYANRNLSASKNNCSSVSKLVSDINTEYDPEFSLENEIISTCDEVDIIEEAIKTIINNSDDNVKMAIALGEIREHSAQDMLDQNERGLFDRYVAEDAARINLLYKLVGQQRIETLENLDSIDPVRAAKICSLLTLPSPVEFDLVDVTSSCASYNSVIAGNFTLDINKSEDRNYIAKISIPIFDDIENTIVDYKRNPTFDDACKIFAISKNIYKKDKHDILMEDVLGDHNISWILENGRYKNHIKYRTFGEIKSEDTRYKNDHGRFEFRRGAEIRINGADGDHFNFEMWLGDGVMHGKIPKETILEDLRSRIRNECVASDQQLLVSGTQGIRSAKAEVPPKNHATEVIEHEKVLRNSGPLEKSEIADMQTLLTDLGYQPGPVDGIMGAKTHAALKQFVSGQTGIEFDTESNAGLRLAYCLLNEAHLEPDSGTACW